MFEAEQRAKEEQKAAQRANRDAMRKRSELKEATKQVINSGDKVWYLTIVEQVPTSRPTAVIPGVTTRAPCQGSRVKGQGPLVKGQGSRGKGD